MRPGLKSAFLASAVVLQALLPGATHAQDGRAAVDTLFAAIAADKARVEALVPLWFGPVSVERVAVYSGFINRLLRNPAFAAYVFAAEGAPGAEGDAYVGRTAYAATQDAVDAGMARLPLAAEAEYLATGTGFAGWVAANHPESCRHLMTADDPQDERTLALQAAYQDTLSPDALYAYLDLGYRAILAEINDAPQVVAFTSEQLERGYQAYARALDAAVMARPNAQALVDAANLRPNATDADVCEVMMLTLTIVDELQPPERDWAVHVIITQQ